MNIPIPSSLRKKAILQHRTPSKSFIVKIVGSGQWAVFFGRFSFPGAAPIAMSIYLENA